MVDATLIARTQGPLIARYIDPDNWMGARIDSAGNVKLIKMLDGSESTVASNTYPTAATVEVRIDVSGSTNVIPIDGVGKIAAADGDITWGSVALTGQSPKFSNVKAGYDTEGDQGGSLKG